MRTAGAKHGRTGRDLICDHRGISLFAEKVFSEKILRELADIGKNVLSYNVVAELSYEVLDNAVKLFDNDDLLESLAELTNELFGKGIYKTELKI